MNFLQKLLRRRRFIVDRRFQFSLMWRSTLFSLFTLAVLGVAWFGPLISGLQGDQAGTIDEVDGALVLLYVHDRLWWVVGAYLVVAFLHSLHISHRIAGPLVRFKRHLRQLAEGRLPEPLFTRTRDYLKAEVHLLNQAVLQLGTCAADLRCTNETLLLGLRDAETLLETADLDAARAALAQAIKTSATIDARLAGFLGTDPRPPEPATRMLVADL